MFESLNKVLRTESKPLEDMGFVHISGKMGGSGIANCSFLVHHFLNYFLRNSFRVCLISCSQTLSQYKIIQHKLGVNLEKAASDSNFMFISALTLSTGLGLNSCLHTESQKSSCRFDEESKKFYNDPVTDILNAVREKMTQGLWGESVGPCLLIVDDLTALHDIGVDTAGILNMICRLKSSFSSTVSALLTTCSKPDPSTADVGVSSLDCQLRHWSELLFHVEELSTGLSKDVHGQMIISYPKQLTGKDEDEIYHYKITDRDIKLFAVGASPAVL